MNNSLFRKYFLTIICLLLAFFVFFGLALGVSAGNFFTNDKKELLGNNCEIAASFYRDTIDSESGGFPVVYRMLQATARSGDCDMFVCDAGGTVMCCTCSDYKRDGVCMHSDGVIGENILKRARSDEGYFEVGDLGGRLESNGYTAARAVTNDAGEAVGTVFATVSADDLQNLYSSLVKMFLIAAILPTCLVIGFAYAASLRLTRPLKSMSEASKAMAKGDFSKRVPVRGNDEIAELARSFNDMCNSLSQLEMMRRSFVANVSHELKTPMTTIAGFVDGILDGTISGDRRDEYLKIVSNEVHRLSRLVQSMLNLSRLESGEQKPNFAENDLSETVISVVLSFERKIEEKGIEIAGLDTMPPAIAEFDGDLIHQVIYNLVDNAVKFTDNGGTVKFSARNTENAVIFTIRNTGAGIGEEDLPHIFERFYKSDRSRSRVKDSTGLGLYIVKSIVDIHGGKIVVRSKVDAYTEFELTLPKKQKKDDLDAGI